MITYYDNVRYLIPNTGVNAIDNEAAKEYIKAAKAKIDRLIIAGSPSISVSFKGTPPRISVEVNSSDKSAETIVVSAVRGL